MRHTDSNNRHRDWRSLIGLVAAATILYVSITGCATSKPVPPVYGRIKTVKVHFKRPLIAGTPEHEPITVEEHIRCGLFYFEQERFDEAADQFEKAEQKISDRKSQLNRACLTSTAVCQLLSDNRPGFIRTVKKLRSTYSRFELVVIEKRDERVKAIFELYDEFIKTGNYYVTVGAKKADTVSETNKKMEDVK